MSEYTEQADKFLVDTDTKFSIVYLYTGPYFDDDKESRDVYQFTLTNKRGSYSAKFGDSIQNTERREFASNGWNTVEVTTNPKARKLGFKNRNEVLKARNKKPLAYDVLAGLTKYDVGTFKDFCADYGYDYDADSIKSQKVYFAVQDEWEGIRKLFTPEQLEQLQEIN